MRCAAPMWSTAAPNTNASSAASATQSGRQRRRSSQRRAAGSRGSKRCSAWPARSTTKRSAGASAAADCSACRVAHWRSASVHSGVSAPASKACTSSTWRASVSVMRRNVARGPPNDPRYASARPAFSNSRIARYASARPMRIFWTSLVPS